VKEDVDVDMHQLHLAEVGRYQFREKQLLVLLFAHHQYRLHQVVTEQDFPRVHLELALETTHQVLQYPRVWQFRGRERQLIGTT
jgi:hypothetical protein